MELITFQAEVLSKKNLTEDVILISFHRPANFIFKAGQFVTLKIKKGENTKMRSYSILSPPSQKESINLCVKIIQDGFASEVFSKLNSGDSLEIKGPFGHFLFDSETENEHWFIGAGTGITPLYSMIKEYLPGSSRCFKLIFGTKTQKDLLFYSELSNLAKKYPNFQYLPVLSREKWKGALGHVQDNLGSDLKNKTFYICGLKELVLETKELLMSKGVDPKNIKSERYS
ncbi:MAG TPA: FAD-binding oxidoreductase [Candidatus Nanoarchaeia archaeon]|nr:FAD-binding oxidoreductase [Candidatus Nanoarchaeia archaeon]